MMQKSKSVARASLLKLMTEMWADVHSGKVQAEDIGLKDYTRKYHVGNFKKSFILHYITQDERPTYDQACKLRREISAYINNRPKHNKDSNRTKQAEIEMQIMPKDKFISECISLLKKEGYIILKKM